MPDHFDLEDADAYLRWRDRKHIHQVRIESGMGLLCNNVA